MWLLWVYIPRKKTTQIFDSHLWWCEFMYWLFSICKFLWDSGICFLCSFPSFLLQTIQAFFFLSEKIYSIVKQSCLICHYSFVIFYLGGGSTPNYARGLLLALCSEITPESLGNIWNGGDHTLVLCARQIPYLLYYFLGPYIVILCCVLRITFVHSFVFLLPKNI